MIEHRDSSGQYKHPPAGKRKDRIHPSEGHVLQKLARAPHHYNGIRARVVNPKASMVFPIAQPNQASVDGALTSAMQWRPG